MELKIKILEIIPNAKNFKIRQSDVISLSFLAENVEIKIDNIEKNIPSKEYILFSKKDFSINEKIHFNLIRNNAIIIGTGHFTPSSGTKWYKIYDLISPTECNINYSSKTLSKKNTHFNDSLINSNIKIKLETQLHILKNKSQSKSKTKNSKKLKYSSKKFINYSTSKNKINTTGLTYLDEKSSNSLMSSNISLTFNRYKTNQNINSYAATPATPGIKSPRYTQILMRSRTNNTNNNNNDSSRENTLKENNILPIYNFDNKMNNINQMSKSTTLGKNFLCQTKLYNNLYGFNNTQGLNKNNSVEKTLGSYVYIENGKNKLSREIEDKIFDQNFKDIIKYDEILGGKEINVFKNDNNSNTINNLEINKKISNESINNLENIINTNNNKEQKINSKNKKNSVLDNKNKNINKNLINNISTNSDNNTIKNNKNNINNNTNFSELYNNELDSNNLKSESNNIIQNSVISSVISTGQIVNSGCDIDISADESASFSANDNITKMYSSDDYKISYDIEKENLTKYEDTKRDFILFYNNEYIKSISDEMLLLELQLIIDKILEMQYIYKSQCYIIQKNFEIYRKKLNFFQKLNLLMNKKMNKLIYEKLKNKYNEDLNDLYYDNKKKSIL